MTALETIPPVGEQRRFCLPPDLRDWAGSKRLVDLVLDVVLATGRQEQRPVDPNQAGARFHPFTLLALLTYSYASGICASDQIESAVPWDAAFKCLCGNRYPDRDTLRRFRRDNRASIEGCLEKVCLEVWAERLGTWEVGSTSGPSHTLQVLADEIDPMIHQQITREV